MDFALVQYLFDGEEHTVLVKPHDNSGGSSSYVRTMLSTVESLKHETQKLTPKFAIAEVSKSIGNTTTAPSAGSLPRSRQQAADARRSQLGTQDRDPLFSIMLMCKESEGKKSQFVRVVTGAPEPMAVLAYD